MQLERLEEKIIGSIESSATSGYKTAALILPLVLLIALGWWESLGFAKFQTGLLYLIPVGLASLRSGKRAGYAISLLSAATMELGKRIASPPLDIDFAVIINIFSSSAIFIFVALIICTLKQKHFNEVNAARVDKMTGLLTPNSFSETLAAEIERCRRYHHHFSVLYIGCPEFKSVISRLGKTAEEGLRRLVAEGIRSCLRVTDHVAQIKDEEFAVLLPETDTESAKAVKLKLMSHLHDAFSQHYPAMVFSLGVVGVDNCEHSPEEIMDRAESAMNVARLASNHIKLIRL